MASKTISKSILINLGIVMIKTSFFKNTVIYTMSDMMTLFVSTFVIIPVVTKTLSLESYSIYSLCINASSLFSFIFLFGIPSAIGLLYSEYRLIKESFITTAICFQIVYSLLILIFLLFFRNSVWNIFVPKIPVSFYFYISIMIAFFTFSQNLLGVIYRYENDAFKFFLLQIVTTGINLLFIFFYYIADDKTEKNAMIIVLGTNICASIYSFLILFRRFFSIKKLNIIILKKIAYCCVPFFLSYLFYFVSNKFFLVFIQQCASSSDVGVFNLLFQYVGLLTIISNIFMKVFSPTFYQYNKDVLWLKKVSIINGFLSNFYCMCILGIFLFGKIVISVFSNPDYYNQEVLFILSIGGFAYVMSSVPNQIILSYKAFKFSNVISFITALITIIFSIFFIKNYGIIGAGMAYAFAQVIMLALSYIVASKKLKKGFFPSIISLGVLVVFIILYFLNLLSFIWIEIIILIVILILQYIKVIGEIL